MNDSDFFFTTARYARQAIALKSSRSKGIREIGFIINQKEVMDPILRK